jgi:Zn-dependent alcohol dehydrogenase
VCLRLPFGSFMVVLGTGGVGLSVIQGACMRARMIIDIDGCGYLRDIAESLRLVRVLPVSLRQ